MSPDQIITRAQIAGAALTVVGRPYQHQGRGELGLDCAGVLVATFRQLGIELQEEIINYRRLPAEQHILRCLNMNFSRLSGSDLQEGDVVHIKFNRDTQARHLGIIVAGDELMIVHALRRNGLVVLDLLRGVLTQAKIAGIYSWPKSQS